MLCFVVNLQGTLDAGEAEDLGNALVEGDGLSNDVTEVSPFLTPVPSQVMTLSAVRISLVMSPVYVSTSST